MYFSQYKISTKNKSKKGFLGKPYNNSGISNKLSKPIYEKNSITTFILKLLGKLN